MSNGVRLIRWVVRLGGVICVVFSSVFSGVALAHVGDFIGSKEGYTQVAIELEVDTVSPEMLDWWWDNINSSERFQQWHPQNNLWFQWEQEPANSRHLPYSVGASYRALQVLAGQQLESVVTWLEPPQPYDCASQDHRLSAKIEFVGFEEVLAPVQMRVDYNRNKSNDGLIIRVVLFLPGNIEEVLPGYLQAVQQHTRESMENLVSFLPNLFQQEFIEDELHSRGSYNIISNGWLTKKVIVDQEIKNLTPQMMNWWWDNIDTTERYKRWHPTAHLAFEWRVPPSRPQQLDYSVGAVQLVSEYIGPYKSNLLITWLDPAEIAHEVEYEHWVYAKTDLKELAGILPQRMFHEYQLNETGDGILMRSTFTVPKFFDFFMPGFSQRLAEHAQQEMQFLSYFLPQRFQREYVSRYGQPELE